MHMLVYIICSHTLSIHLDKYSPISAINLQVFGVSHMLCKSAFLLYLELSHCLTKFRIQLRRVYRISRFVLFPVYVGHASDVTQFLGNSRWHVSFSYLMYFYFLKISLLIPMMILFLPDDLLSYCLAKKQTNKERKLKQERCMRMSASHQTCIV